MPHRHRTGLRFSYENSGFFSQEFTAAIVSAGARARVETFEAAVPVFYRDMEEESGCHGTTGWPKILGVFYRRRSPGRQITA